MADEEKESARRKGLVRRIEMMQVASAVAIGLMLLPVVVEKLAYYGWWWATLALVALFGAIRPLFIETTQNQARLVENYVVNDVRIAILKQLGVPDDVILALGKITPFPFSGTGLQLRDRFFEVIGEERGAEFLDQLYKYTRGEPIPAPAPTPAMPGPQMPIAKPPATAESAPPPSPA
jgi:small basic protein